ncbi:YcaO-like family protein [Candidatus Saccharibacteria bacterium]|nr:MAG: YcaO-like family protein [Candidatus Saccharibacteria bacterium]
MVKISSNLKNELLLTAANFRHGIVLKPQTAQTGLSDIPSIWHVGIPQNSSEPWKSAAGGVSRNLKDASIAAIGEGLERYSASAYELPVKLRSEIDTPELIGPEDFSLFSKEQVKQTDFPFANLYEDETGFTNVYSVYDNQEKWVPHGLVSLRDDFSTGLSTSSGLAAGYSKQFSLLRAIQELIERDALMTTWLHSVPGRKVETPKKYLDEIIHKGGNITCIDATPAYSPHPVAIVAGSLPIRGNQRYSLGSACRETWEEALEKAYLEWVQGVFFAGYYYSLNPDLQFNSYDEVNTFDSHAVYYTVNPSEWAKIPLLKGDNYKRQSQEVKSRNNTIALTKLIKALHKQNIRLFYRDLTTSDLLQLGVYTIRALSPDMLPIYCHQKYPFIGGTASDVLRRYPWAKKHNLEFPNSMPHPLG